MLDMRASSVCENLAHESEPSPTVARQNTMVGSSRHEIEAGIEALLPRLWRFAITLTRDGPAAEDLVQDTCVRMLDKAALFRAGSHLDRWAFTIMVNLWRTKIRSQSVGGLDAELEVEEVWDTRPWADEQLFAKQVLEAVDALPLGQRAVLVLVLGEGFSYREAAAILNIPIGTVMSRLNTARARLAHLATN